MEQKYIDLVINRLTQAQYDEKLKNGEIYEEQIYDIIDHDDLFYYRTELYTRTEIESKLSTTLSTLRNELATEKEALNTSISNNTTEITSIKEELIPGVQTDLISTNNDLKDFKTKVSNTYATKKELSEYSPVEANPTLTGNEAILNSINIDGTSYQVYPEGEIEFDTVKSTDTNALTLQTIRVGNDTWILPSGGSSSNIEGDFYTKSEVDGMISSVDVRGQLKNYALKTEIPSLNGYATQSWVEGKNYLTEHQSLAGYATESYVNTKVASLVNSAPDALNTLTELATALGNDPNFATTITTELSKKANLEDVYTKTEVDNAISNVEVDLTDYYTKEEIDSKDFTNVSANPEVTGEEIPLSTISIKGVNYSVSSGEGDNSLILSDTPVEGADNLASITINGDSWNIVGSGGGGGSLNPEDLADYYTKTQVNNLVSTEISKVVGVAPDAYNTLKEIADYIESDLDTGAALEASIAKKANSSDVYTKSEANAKYALKSDIPAPTDLSNYYTKTETLNVIDKISGLDNYYDAGTIDTKFETVNATKQDILVSGENIKTINGVSIMGVGNILINEGGSGGTPVEANPALDGTELDLTAISINNVNYAIPAGDMVFSEEVVQDQKTLKTIVIDGDIWSIEKGSTLLANPPLTGNEDPLESVKIDDTVYTLKGEEMLFYENEIEGAVPLKTIVINGDPWYVGGISEEKVDAKINTRINSLVNAAPDTLDTLGELAEALQENSSVVETLNSAISNKADKTEIIKSYNNLTDKPTIPNIVYSETEPTNPTQGMIWLKPL